MWVAIPTFVATKIKHFIHFSLHNTHLIMVTIYHNPKCSKSRDCLAFIENSNNSFEIIKYLETPLSYAELDGIIKKLKIKPIDLIRTKEAIWGTHFEGRKLTRKQIINAMVKYPILMERPI